MRIPKKSADEPLENNANNERLRRDSRRSEVDLPRIGQPLGVLSAAALLTLTACSEPREPSYDVSDATISQYENTCALCHEKGDGGAPVTGDKDDWEQRVAKGMRKVHENAVVGYEGATGIMPAKGGYMDLTDDEVIAIVDYMVDLSL
jgi:cytochrome c5